MIQEEAEFANKPSESQADPSLVYSEATTDIFDDIGAKKNSEPPLKSLLSPLTTQDGAALESSSNADTSALDGASSKSSTWWKNKKKKMKLKMPKMIKNVLTPRKFAKSTPKSLAYEDELDKFSTDKNEEDIPSGLEEEEDIFEGLEDDTISKLVREASKPKEGPTPKMDDLNSLTSMFNPYFNRSGTVLDGAEILDDVNSDITSSVLGGNGPVKQQIETDQPNALESAEAKEVSTESVVKSKDQNYTAATTVEPNTPSGIDTAEIDDYSDSSESDFDPSNETPGSMFMNLGCGFVDTFATGMCTFGSDPTSEDHPEDENDETLIVSADTANSSKLTDLEKRVWEDWDKRDSTLKTWDEEGAVGKQAELNHKREVARGKLLEIASSAISSQMQNESELDEEDSGKSPEAVGLSTVVEPSEIASNPILLSLGQMSLIEKFSKQLAMNGVGVLKLNRRKQWQVRYFTISKELIALTAHEQKCKTGDVAQCPKALLWLKQFDRNNGGYAVTNIDKSGHGGMLFVDLVDVTVTNIEDTQNPIPKKLMNTFKNSVSLSMHFEMDGQNRSVEFRCKDNDEAQFMCTCMKGIRDLLKQERSLRLEMKSD